jgi:hypothetical protein
VVHTTGYSFFRPAGFFFSQRKSASKNFRRFFSCLAKIESVKIRVNLWLIFFSYFTVKSVKSVAKFSTSNVARMVF